MKTETFEERDRRVYLESEYSKKGSPFYFSYAKWKRLSGRCCKALAHVFVYDPKIGKPSHSWLRLDSSKCDNIGITQKSLDTYMKSLIGRKKKYEVLWWSLTAY